MCELRGHPRIRGVMGSRRRPQNGPGGDWRGGEGAVVVGGVWLAALAGLDPVQLKQECWKLRLYAILSTYALPVVYLKQCRERELPRWKSEDAALIQAS